MYHRWETTSSPRATIHRDHAERVTITNWRSETGRGLAIFYPHWFLKRLSIVVAKRFPRSGFREWISFFWEASSVIYPFPVLMAKYIQRIQLSSSQTHGREKIFAQFSLFSVRSFSWISLTLSIGQKNRVFIRLKAVLIESRFDIYCRECISMGRFVVATLVDLTTSCCRESLWF